MFYPEDLSKDSDWLVCQDCGDKIRILSAFERQDIKSNPYNYVAYCWADRQARRDSGY